MSKQRSFQAPSKHRVVKPNLYSRDTPQRKWLTTEFYVNFWSRFTQQIQTYRVVQFALYLAAPMSISSQIQAERFVSRFIPAVGFLAFWLAFYYDTYFLAVQFLFLAALLCLALIVPCWRILWTVADSETDFIPEEWVRCYEEKVTEEKEYQRNKALAEGKPEIDLSPGALAQSAFRQVIRSVQSWRKPHNKAD